MYNIPIKRLGKNSVLNKKMANSQNRELAIFYGQGNKLLL